MTIEEKLRALRKKLKENNLDAYYITGSDAHQSEYVAPHWRTREFISGFTGSAGTVVVTMDKALLWVDSRYFIQAESQIKGTELEMMRIDTSDPSVETWLLDNLKEKNRLGVEESEISIKLFDDLTALLKEKDIEFVETRDILSSVWTDRPGIPESSIREMKSDYAGLSSSDKIDILRGNLKKKGLSWTFIASLDDIAWLTNLRADDIPYNPVFYSFMFVGLDKAVLFTDKGRFNNVDMCTLPFEVRDYSDVYSSLGGLIKGKGYYNPERISMSFKKFFSSSDATGRDITTDLKAVKNETERDGMRRSHIEDGIAYVNFLSHLDRSKNTNEIAISSALEKEREKRPGYLGPSFGPISGFSSHGAMCHYSATEESNMVIDKSGLLVLDTGSQFEFGMTDITRTLLFGEASEEERRDYTLVLKGHLALARQRFIKGTCGVHLDVLAKQYLWQNGESFYHGTGHGVGCHLNVHEGPMKISSHLIDVPLSPGMVISDEPGVYKEGRHGVRIENLLMVRDDITTEFGTFYSFEVLTLVPYERDLIDVSLLTDEEISQINGYHKRIYDTLIDKVDPSSVEYLVKATSPITRN